MESLGISHQTLRDFLDNPFYTKNEQKQLKYEDRYQSYKKNNKIKIESSIEFEKSYFIHLKVPSESQKGETYYDVVIQFFTSDPMVEKELTVENYYVQFFSNSPGFMYKYAALYKMQGYLIETLYDKFDRTMLDTLPDNANSSYELYYDSSIYYACRYLIDNKLSVLGKLSIKIFKTKPVQSFFNDIQDTNSIQISRDIFSLKKEIEKDTKLSASVKSKVKQKNEKLGKQLSHYKDKIKAKKSTFKDQANNSKIKTRKGSTSKSSSIKKITTKKKTSKR